MAQEYNIIRNVLAAAVFLLAPQWVYSQIVGSEACPLVTVATGTNSDTLTGTWHENRKYSTNADNVTACTKFVFEEPEPFTKIVVVKINAITKPGDKPIEIQGTAMPITPTSSKHLVEFQGLKRTTYHILGYSPKKWILIWACSNYDYFHVQQAYLLTQDKFPSKDTVEEALAVAKANDIPRWLFRITDQVHC